MTDAQNAKTYAMFSAQRNKKLISKLESKGYKILLLPAADIEKLFSNTNLDDNLVQIIKNIKEFEWIIFTDVFAAEFFLEILEIENFDVFELDEIRICSLGSAAADRLRFAQIHTDIIPQKLSTEAIINSIENYIGGKNNFAGKKILIVREFNEKLVLVEELIERDAIVSELSIYAAEFPQAGELPKIKALIKGGAVDEIIFSTPEEFLYCRFLFREENIKKVLAGIKISVATEVTFQTVSEHSLLPMFLKL